MRRLLVALFALSALAFAGPVIVFAQDAPPADGAEGTALDRTDVRYFLPFTPDGLNTGLTVSEDESGVCGFSSIVALDRPDAWDCIGDSNQIYDPCFENPFAPPDDPGQLACVASPFTAEVTLLTLSAPLEREKEPADDAGMGQGASADTIAPWDLPWALELANGDQCTLLHGTLTVMAGQIVHYGCVDGGMVLGETDHGQSIWTVNYLADGDVASNLVAVTAAWS
jgi:hypothetical protein